MRLPEARPYAPSTRRRWTGIGRGGRPDLTPLTAAQRDLARAPVVVAAARRLVEAASRRRPRLRDEYESAALFAVVRAARSFDPSKGAWPDYAALKVTSALREVRRLERPLGFRRHDQRAAVPGVGSLDVPLWRTELGSLVLLGEFVPARGPGRSVEDADHCAVLLGRLRGRERAAVRLYYGLGCEPRSMRRVGAALGVCEGMASRLISRALDQLREGRTT